MFYSNGLTAGKNQCFQWKQKIKISRWLLELCKVYEVISKIPGSMRRAWMVYCFGSFISTPLILLITSIIVACYGRETSALGFSHVKTTSASIVTHFFFCPPRTRRRLAVEKFRPISQTSVSSFRRVGLGSF